MGFWYKRYDCIAPDSKYLDSELTSLHIDEHLLLCGLEATKNCMSRSKIWLTDMEPILADIIRRSSSLELQHVRKQLNYKHGGC